MTALQTLVPQTETVAEVYAIDNASARSVTSEYQTRWNGLISRFTKLYGQRPDFVSRSPGRVNIIGEHIDYSLYDVLPTAVSVDVTIAVKAIPSSESDPFVKISNVEQDKFPSREFNVPYDTDIEIDPERHEWVNYFKAGMLGALRVLRRERPSISIVSVELLVDGNVPPGGGISSSAAFVCASALAVLKANGYNISKQDLLSLAVVSERSVGVSSGGMDQAASIFSTQGYLLYTKFFPHFSVDYVPVPKTADEITFLVAQSFVTSNKADAASRQYNLRVAECSLAAAVLAAQHDVIMQRDNSPLGYSLRNFHYELMRKRGQLDASPEEQLEAVTQVAIKTLSRKQGYTREEIAKLLCITVADLEAKYLSAFPVQTKRFRLRQRALHCFNEARRVLDFKACLSQSEILNEQHMLYLGKLLNDSQSSCRDMYECSCAQVDEICSIARRAGTWGSRLTGAGWGGCTVHMLPQSKVAAVTEALRNEYYLKYFPDICEEKLKQAMVISKPSNGSFIISGAAITEVNV